MELFRKSFEKIRLW